MKFEDVVQVVGNVPICRPEDGKLLYEFVLQSGARDLLELGFAHGTSTCYLAAALDEVGEGHIITIDNQTAKERKPSLPDLLEKLKLGKFVTPIFAETSYNWELMKIIEANTKDGACQQIYDFCFIDGAHLWEPDGLAFFLADKLLRPGATLLFDDIPWTIASSPSVRSRPEMQALSEEQVTCRQVEKVFTLLVGQHPAYTDLAIRDNWGWARKRVGAGETGATKSGAVDAAYDERGIGQDFVALLRKIKHKVVGARK